MTVTVFTVPLTSQFTNLQLVLRAPSAALESIGAISTRPCCSEMRALHGELRCLTACLTASLTRVLWRDYQTHHTLPSKSACSGSSSYAPFQNPHAEGRHDRFSNTYQSAFVLGLWHWHVHSTSPSSRHQALTCRDGQSAWDEPLSRLSDFLWELRANRDVVSLPCEPARLRHLHTTRLHRDKSLRRCRLRSTCCRL